MATYAIIRPIRPDARKEVVVRVRSTRFGDGYEQVSRDGINPVFRTWDVTFMADTETNNNTFETALEAAMGDGYVTWQAPGEAAPTKWRIKSYSTIALAGRLYELSCKLERRYGI